MNKKQRDEAMEILRACVEEMRAAEQMQAEAAELKAKALRRRADASSYLARRLLELIEGGV